MHKQRKTEIKKEITFLKSKKMVKWVKRKRIKFWSWKWKGK